MTAVTEKWHRTGQSKKGTYDIYTLEGSTWITMYRKAGQFGQTIEVEIRPISTAPTTTEEGAA